MDLVKDQALQGEDGIRALRDALDRLKLQGRDDDQESDDGNDDDDDDDGDESEGVDAVRVRELATSNQGLEDNFVGEVQNGSIEVLPANGKSVESVDDEDEIDEQKFVVVVDDVDGGSHDAEAGVEKGSNEVEVENEAKRLEPETDDIRAEHKAGRPAAFNRKPSVRKSVKKTAANKTRQQNNQQNSANVKKQ